MLSLSHLEMITLFCYFVLIGSGGSNISGIIVEVQGSDDANDTPSQAQAQTCACFPTIVEILIT